MTVIWHVDDLKVSHKDLVQVKKFGDWLEETYGKKVARHSGKIHDYLGMVLDYSHDRNVTSNK